MKAIISIYLALLIFIPTISAAESAKNPLPATENNILNDEKFQAQEWVMAQPARHAKTVDLYISKMAAIPGAKDLGWQVHKVDNGYEVIREIQKSMKVFSFKWGVSDTGEITPLNKRAQDITKQPDPVPEKDAN